YAGRRTGAAVVWHVHNGLLGYPIRQRLSDLMKVRFLARGCDAVVAVSDQVGRDALRRGFPAEKLNVIQNGVALDHFERAPLDPREARRRLGVVDDAFVVLAFGWPPARKGADVLVEALSRMTPGELARPLAVVLVGEP